MKKLVEKGEKRKVVMEEIVVVAELVKREEVSLSLSGLVLSKKEINFKEEEQGDREGFDFQLEGKSVRGKVKKSQGIYPESIQ